MFVELIAKGIWWFSKSHWVVDKPGEDVWGGLIEGDLSFSRQYQLPSRSPRPSRTLPAILTHTHPAPFPLTHTTAPCPYSAGIHSDKRWEIALINIFVMMVKACTLDPAFYIMSSDVHVVNWSTLWPSSGKNNFLSW